VVGVFMVLYLRRSIDCVGVEVEGALRAPLDYEIIDCGELSIFIHPLITVTSVQECGSSILMFITSEYRGKLNIFLRQ
jgi:hypothetical protein